MPTITVQETAATAVVGFNLMSGNRVQVSNRNRRVRRIGVVGSAVLQDAEVQLFYGSNFVGNFKPTTIGVVVPLDARDMMPVVDADFCPAGESLNLFISDAPATNPIVATLEIEEF